MVYNVIMGWRGIMRMRKFSKLILLVLIGVSLYSIGGKVIDSEKPPLQGIGTYEKVESIW